MTISITDLKPDKTNRRKHGERNVDMIVQSLHEIGAARSIVVDEDGNILAGNATVEAAARAGIERVQVVDADGQTIIAVRRSNLDAEDKRKLALYDNRTAELAEWDTAQIAADLEAGLSFDGLFSADELTALLEGEPKKIAEAPEPQLDRAEELRELWGTERGQVWEIPSVTVPGKCHRLMCGDSTSADDVGRLMAGATPDTVVFDPPYDGDNALLTIRWPCKDALVFSNYRHLLDAVDGWPSFRCAFVWDGYTSWWYSGWPLARGRFCLWFGEGEYNADGAHYGEPEEPRMVQNTRGRSMYRPDPRGKHLSTIYGEAEPKQFDGHPHSKPVTWFRMLLANCTQGLVFDPYVGSGTTTIAAEQIGRLSLGMEIEAGALAVTLERLVGLGLQPVLATH